MPYMPYSFLVNVNGKAPQTTFSCLSHELKLAFLCLLQQKSTKKIYEKASNSEIGRQGREGCRLRTTVNEFLTSFCRWSIVCPYLSPPTFLQDAPLKPISASKNESYFKPEHMTNLQIGPTQKRKHLCARSDHDGIDPAPALPRFASQRWAATDPVGTHRCAASHRQAIRFCLLPRGDAMESSQGEKIFGGGGWARDRERDEGVVEGCADILAS
jgi:hypothetical protein